MQENVGDTGGFQVLNPQGALEFLGDTQAVYGLLGPLAQSLEKDIANLEQLLAQGDLPEVAGVLHSLKGFLPVFCHAAFNAQLVGVEKKIRLHDSPALRDEARALIPTLHQLKAEARAYLQHKR
jgi:HPt (histidine-containing phosphotransfer) domain-containing protein